MNKWTLRFVSFLAMLVAVRVTPVPAQQLELRMRQGYDTNVYEIGAASASGRVDGYYTRLGVFYTSPSSNRGASLIVRPQAHLEWYPQTSSGNQLGGSMLLRFQNIWKDRGPAKRKTTVRLDVSGGYERALFLKRSAREELQVGTLDGSLSLADLPSRFEGQTQLSLRVRTSKRLTVAGAAFGRLKNYVESSNPSLPSYNRLDAHEFGGILEVTADVTRAWELSASGGWRNRIYPNRNAATVDGVTVPGEYRQFWYWDVEAATALRWAALRNKARASYRRRSDRFEGYYSYDQWELADRVTVALNSALDLRFRYAYGQRQYDLFAPAGSPTLNNYHEASVEIGAALPGSSRLVIGPHYERALSNDPVFDYERFDLFAEVRVGR